MSSHKAQQRNKQPPRLERDKGKPMVQQSVRTPPVVVAVVPTAEPRHVPPRATVSSPAVAPLPAATPMADASEAENEPPAPSPVVAPAPVPKSATSTGEMHPTKHISQRTPTPPSELSEMFATMRALFVQDRTNGSRTDAARCGVCYLTFARDQLVYREEEGFYACPDCQTALNNGTLPMLRKQRR